MTPLLQLRGIYTIIINVGGKDFKTTLQTLTVYPDSVLAKSFTAAHKQSCVDGCYSSPAFFIDRSPVYFAVVLELLRTGRIALTPNIAVSALERELDFYGLSEYVTADNYDDPYHSMGSPFPRLDRSAKPVPSVGSTALPMLDPSIGARGMAGMTGMTTATTGLVHPVGSVGISSLARTTPPALSPLAESTYALSSTVQSTSNGSYIIPPSPTVVNTCAAVSTVAVPGAAAVSSSNDTLQLLSARRLSYEDSWATSMACRAAPILTKAMNAGLLRFTVFIDPYGKYKGVPSQLLSQATDLMFWQDFASSFAAAPPGSAQDFSQSFRENFNVTLTASYPTQMKLPGHVIAVIDVDGKPGQESEALSWVVFRVKTMRSERRQLLYVDRTSSEGPVSESTVGLVLLHGWELHFNMPETLTASKVLERTKTMVHGLLRSEDIMTNLFLLN
ncbi:hypothetical protein BASA50_001193 [Batrachochytrium salamandrivorans]|uniref:BTB domain-containing protein n=1 Tax=Batrachochytrium salamandrivorans TaxID=1357716 RepID=A0ABQ8ERW5_9FUNG|nr:hypothetical protein BASA60_002078 [Batrachochytrium salamandrivorans]KAH6585584.1 hypothetical protein BASA50_001193 [Batrachochytrium salamandrivorans]